DLQQRLSAKIIAPANTPKMGTPAKAGEKGTMLLDIEMAKAGKIRARRQDRTPLTDNDWGTVERFGGFAEVFGSIKVTPDNPLFCSDCEQRLAAQWKRLWEKASMAELVGLLNRRGARIVERVWPDGRRNWGCHKCGRTIREEKIQ